jgi:hypothetical protein
MHACVNYRDREKKIKEMENQKKNNNSNTLTNHQILLHQPTTGNFGFSGI